MPQTTTSPVVANRYDFVYFFDCKDGNPNGDPDMANTPRFDPETFQGIVTDVCLKRKIRDYVFALKSQGGEPEHGYDIYVLQGHSLESRQEMSYKHLELKEVNASDSESEEGADNSEEEPAKDKKGKRFKQEDAETIKKARKWMCENFFDVRAFGAVMSIKRFNCGQVRGPVQMTFSRSIDRVLSTQHGISRVNQTKEKDQIEKGGAGTFGDKHTIAYGLYVTHGFINPFLADPQRKGTGFNEADLDILWKALTNMFDMDRSASRGLMGCRGLWVFKHDSPLGNAPAQKLFDLVQVLQVPPSEKPARDFSDYKDRIIAPQDGSVPGFSGVSVKRLA